MDLGEIARYVGLNFWRKGLHRSTSSGTVHKFLPVVLNSSGKLDSSLYDSTIDAYIAGRTSKATPVDADSVPLVDSAASSALKRVTWANIKATLKTYFDTIYGTLASGNTWTGANSFNGAVDDTAVIYTINRRYFGSKNSSGTLGRLMGMNASNLVVLGDVDNIAGDVALLRSGSQVVLLNTNKQVNIIAGGSSGQEARLGGILYQSITTVGNVGGGTDDLMSYAIPAGVLDRDGASIWFEAVFTLANNANNKTTTVAFGATTLATLGGTGGNKQVGVSGRIWRVSATSQRAYATLTDSTSTAFAYYTTPAETLSNSITIKGTGNSAASATNDIQQIAFTVGFDPLNT